MVGAAEQYEVAERGLASVGPVPDVVGLQVVGSAAAGEPAAPVTPAQLASEASSLSGVATSATAATPSADSLPPR